MFPLKDNLGTDRLPLVTLLLIAANAVLFLFVHGGGIAGGSGAEQAVDGLHLLVSLLLLWIFGSTVEDSMTRWRYGLFCAGGGLIAVGVHAALSPDGDAIPSLASSGVLAAVIGGYLLLYPRARVVSVVAVVLLSTIVEVPVWVLVALWAAVEAVVGATSLGHVAGEAGAVALLAQLGALLFGLLAIGLFADRRKQVPSRVKVAA